MISETNRLNYVQSYGYDANDKMNFKKDFKGLIHSFEESDFGRSRDELLGEEEWNHFEFDFSGNCLQADNQNYSLKYNFNQAGLLVSLTDENICETVYYTYDRAGRKTRVKGCDRDISYIYGKNGELLEIYDNISKLSVTLEYDIMMRETKRSFGNKNFVKSYYDKSGRKIAYYESDARGNILFAEAWLCYENGRVSYTINESGQITMYEYDSAGQVKKVYYPATQSRIDSMKKEADKYQTIHMEKQSPSENIFIKNSILQELQELTDCFPFNIQIPSIQVLCAESYEHDMNGNIISKENALGKIDYIYDAENHLKEICANGKSVIKYNYDENGNLTEEINSEIRKQIKYSASNRMTEIIKTGKDFYSTASFSYDAFNRRVLRSYSQSQTLRTVYDGFSFDILKESPVYENGLYTNTFKDLYQMTDFSYKTENNLSGSFNDSEESRTFSESYPLYISGKPVGRNQNYINEYFCTESNGTVRNVTNQTGDLSDEYEYDIFGKVISNEYPVFGFNGKKSDTYSDLYDFGFRDYSPSFARFTTQDPIRDGANWFSYCHNDPINFLDMWGLFSYKGNKQISNKKTTIFVLRESDGTGNEFNSIRQIIKEDNFGNKEVVYEDKVGANCREKYKKENKGDTLPDGEYYLTDKGTDKCTLFEQEDGTTDSSTYDNVLSIRTKDEDIPKDVRDKINTDGDFLLHASKRAIKEEEYYNNNDSPGSAGCIIGKDGQQTQDTMMDFLLDGVGYPEEITLEILSLNNVFNMLNSNLKGN